MMTMTNTPATCNNHHNPNNNNNNFLSASTPVAAYTGHPFPAHATSILAEAAKKHNFTSPYWLTSRVVRNKNIELKEGTPQPTGVCLEGDGTPKVYNAYFVDDINPDDLSLFLRDVMMPLPENAWIAGTPSSFMTASLSSSHSNKNNHRRHHSNNYHGRYNHNNNGGFSPAIKNSVNVVSSGVGGGHFKNSTSVASTTTTMTPIVYVFYKERWRCPGNSNCAQKLCKWIHDRRGPALSAKLQAEHQRNQQNDPFFSSSSPPFAPVFIQSDYVDGGNMRLLPNAQSMLIEDSTITLFYNADQTTLPPHSVVPIGVS